MLSKVILHSGLIVLMIVAILVSCTTPSKPQLGASTNPVSINVQTGKSGTGSFTLTNTGDGELNYSLTASNNIIFNKTSGTILPESTETVSVLASCPTRSSSSETITVSSNGGNASVPVNFNCTTATNSTYDIEVRFIGNSTTSEQQAAFTQAELQWEGVITNEFVDTVLSAASEIDPRFSVFCDADEPELKGETVDDLLILAKVGFIDGDGDATNGNILAQAGPVLVRGATEDELTLLGCMIFDENDIDLLVQGGSFADVVLHEMGHVLGIGTYWDPLFDTNCPSTNAVGFSGTNAVLEFGVLTKTFSGSKPPVETQGGAGTACGHWDEAFFDNEIMTGLAEESGIAMPLSALTIGSLEDLGYGVDYSQAGRYVLPSCQPNCSSVEPQAKSLPWERLLTPIASVDSKGIITLKESR